MNIEVPLEGMTWHDLRAFVRLGRDEPAGDEVLYDYDFDEGQSPRALLFCGLSTSMLAKRRTSGA